MLPFFSASNLPNVLRGSIVHLCDLPLNNSLIFETSYSTNINDSEFCSPVPLTPCHHTFPACISQVVPISSKEKVVRIDAGRVIPTRAVMANKKTFTNRSIYKKPRIPMGQYVSPRKQAEPPIRRITFGVPYPTRITLFYLTPKPFLIICFKTLFRGAFSAACFASIGRIGLISISANGTKACHHKELTFLFGVRGHQLITGGPKLSSTLPV